MNPQDIIQDIHSGLSVVREWIEKLLEDNKEHAIPLQEDFENDRLLFGLIDLMQQRTDAVWADVASLISGDFIANYNIQ